MPLDCNFDLIQILRAGQDSYDIHGVSLCPLWNFETTGWVQKAVENCFVVVWPVGNNEPSLSPRSCWAMEGGFNLSFSYSTVSCGNDDSFNDEFDPAFNDAFRPKPDEFETGDCCCNFGQSNPEASVFDDMTFLRNVAAVAVDAVAEQSNGAVTINTKRIYMGGHSNGCSAGLAMAAVHTDMVAAVCCHSPALVTPFPDDDSYSEQAVPIWLAYGKKDGRVNYFGALIRENIYVPGAQQTVAMLGNVNNCVKSYFQSIMRYDLNMTYSGCDNDATVEMYSLENAGHVPFMGADLFFGDLDGAEVTTIDTTQYAWEFCSKYARASDPVLELVKPDTSSGDGDQQESESASTTRFNCWKWAMAPAAILWLAL